MFSRRRNTVIVLHGTCEICHGRIEENQAKIVCSGDTCNYHKKCFKGYINYENDQAISLGHKGNKNYKKSTCDCGSNGIKVINDRKWIFRKYGGFLLLPFAILLI